MLLHRIDWRPFAFFISLRLSEGFWCSQEAKGFQQPNICIPAFITKIHTVDKKGPKTFSVLYWFGFGSNKKHQVTIELTGSSIGPDFIGPKN